MCIDLVGIQYIQKIHYFGRAIQDARYALVNVGGKMVHVPDLMRYAAVLQQKYGDRKSKANVYVRGAFIPKNISAIRFIDHSAQPSSDNIYNFTANIFLKSNELAEMAYV
ncbi:unnamed protein product [Dracunculus medinensis]|uniref:Uncharacterized protein n=1 Tax=Dracunculus medinensis TaxID=318479 RepID=A0A158Q2S3_DRAME|nr:unnamed protein product [Dracunculus medinensis]